MRTRVLFSAGVVALVTASCAQPEPQVLSDAPRSASATELSTMSETTSRESGPGRFIARCATEADGGTPGMTFFTDGSQNVTDHCLSRYYIGVQPAPGALYVADEDAGTYAPPRESPSGATSTAQWTPAQPRTDLGPAGEVLDGDPRDDEPGEEPGTDESETTTPPTGTDTPSTSPGTTTPTSPTPGTPGGTEPGTTDPTSPGVSAPLAPGEGDQPTPGSSEPVAPTAVPTVTGPGADGPAADDPPAAQPTAAAPTSVPQGSLGSFGPQVPGTPRGSQGLPLLEWPGAPVS